MPTLWRSLAVPLLTILAVVLAACGASPSAAPQAVQKRGVFASPAAGASPVVLSAGSAHPATASASDAATALRTPLDGTPLDGQQIVIVDSTDGEGVWLRRQPAGEPVRVWPDGAPMLVVGEDKLADGRNWRNVVTLDGQTGWVAADYVQTADISALAAGFTLPNDPPAAATRNGIGSPGLQARLAVANATPAPAPEASAPPTGSRTLARAPSMPLPGTTGQAVAAAATATPQAAVADASKPTSTPLPAATPIKAPAGATSFDAGSATLEVAGSQKGLGIKIGNRPRDGMELLAVQVSVTNHDDAPFALYRGSFRLGLSDRSRVEPLAGGNSPLPYSTEIDPGESFDGWLTFEVPTGTRVDSLIWAPERDVAYSLGVKP